MSTPELPTSTYRLQIRPSLDLFAAAELVPYLHRLGVSWVYLSPLLRATTGSDHGYDVVDVSRVDPARGGTRGLDTLAAAAHSAGLGVLVDIVPNHMGVSIPRENPWWWSVLRLGNGSPYARWFDIDWAFGNGRVRLPVLGAQLDEVIGDIQIDPTPASDAPDGVLRYHDHVLPLAPGSLVAGQGAEAVLARQHYELRFWRDEAAELNYRRFFAVSTLAGVRVEVPEVFRAAHAEVLRWIRDGLVDGLRVDHPDGLIDPGVYLDQLAEASGGAPVWVEKILEHAATDHPERLLESWQVVGTTGYDAMAEIDRVLIDPAGEAGLLAVDAAVRSAPSQPWGSMIHRTKRAVADTIQASEVNRLVRVLPAPTDGAADALAEILAWFPTYRSYLPDGSQWLHQAATAASASRPELANTIAALLPMLADPKLEVARRFQQTTGPVMAKGVEDSAFYRYTRLGTLTEVGGDPSVFSLSVSGLHQAFAARQAARPGTLVALSTHDTKRGEDVRARLSVLAEIPTRWATVLGTLRSIAKTENGPFDNLLWQAIVGSWPASPERLHAYAEKAAREAGEQTTWLVPSGAFEADMHAIVDAAFSSACDIVEAFVSELASYGWSNSLSAKLLQLTAPGVPDVYQGSELWEQSLVDPDNRRAVDFEMRERMLAELDNGLLPEVDETGAAKLLLVSRALRLRRDRPELFTGYRAVLAAGEASEHLIGYDRGGALALATRLPVTLARRGGWGTTTVTLPEGSWVDALTGARFNAGAAALADILNRYPVALLTRDDAGPEVGRSAD